MLSHLHRLNNKLLAALLDRLENKELDGYADIATLIGIEFDENTEWGSADRAGVEVAY